MEKIALKQPFIFQAEWPQSFASSENRKGPRRIIEKFLSIVMPGPKMLRNHFKQITYRAIMPGALDKTPEKSHKILRLFLDIFVDPHSHRRDCTTEENNLLRIHSGKKVTFRTPDHVAIDAAYFEGRIPRKAIVFSGGNCSQWEEQKEWLEALKKLGVSVLLFNPRGVGLSEGKYSSKGWALDFYTACEYLIQEKDILPENILPVGFSMGGATAARGAALLQEKYSDKNISALNVCSFSDLSLEVKSLAGRMGVLGLRLLGISMPVQQKFGNLKGEKIVFHRPNDEIISPIASMAQAVTNNKDIQTISLEEWSMHNSPLSESEKTTIQKYIRNVLNLQEQPPPGILPARK